MFTMYLTIEQSFLNKKKNAKSYGTNRLFKIFHNPTCKNDNLIYWLQFRMSKNSMCRKRETTFKICLNNHAKPEKSILAYKHFNELSHEFQPHVEFDLTNEERN